MTIEPTAFTDARVLLDRYGLRAKKQFGQNFLISERAFRGIVDATVQADDDWVVEIGSGLGTLTARLAERVPEGKVIALERDPDMITVLRGELGNVENVHIEPGDALKYDLAMAARWRGDKITVCGNLPYHVAAPILFRIVDSRSHIKRAVVMIQKEMADRIIAPPGGKDYGAMGVMIQTYLNAKSVVKVSPGAFVPAPKVDSTVLLLTPLLDDKPRFDIGDPTHYSRVVHAAFGQRRKTLRNAVRAAFEDIAVDDALIATTIDGARRGETLTLAEFASLSRAISVTAWRGGPEGSRSVGAGLAEEPDASDA